MPKNPTVCTGAYFKTAAELTVALPEIFSQCSSKDILKTVFDLRKFAAEHIKNSENFKDDAEMYIELTEYAEKLSAQGDTLNAAEREYRIELLLSYRRYRYEIQTAERYLNNAAVLETALNQPKTEKTDKQPIKISEPPKKTTIDLKNSVVAFSGALQMARATARQKVTDAGGTWSSGVTRKTNILVVGIYENFNSPNGEKSEKLQKAEKLIAEGYQITIIDEAAFNNLLAKNP